MSEASLLGYPELRGIFGDLPDTPVIQRAFDFARARMPHSLFNHVTRTALAQPPYPRPTEPPKPPLDMTELRD